MAELVWDTTQSGDSRDYAEEDVQSAAVWRRVFWWVEGKLAYFDSLLLRSLGTVQDGLYHQNKTGPAYELHTPKHRTHLPFVSIGNIAETELKRPFITVLER